MDLEVCLRIQTIELVLVDAVLPDAAQTQQLQIHQQLRHRPTVVAAETEVGLERAKGLFQVRRLRVKPPLQMRL